MVTNKIIIHGTHKDPQLIERARVALALSTKDNVDRIMTDLEKSQKKGGLAERNFGDGKG